MNRTSRDATLRPGAHVSIVANTVAFALRQGVTLDQIATATGIRAQDLADPTTRLPEEVMPLIWGLLSEHVESDQPLTMKMAEATPLSFFADIAHGIQFATNVREALELLVYHGRILVDQVEARLHIGVTEVALVASHPLDVLDAGRSSEMAAALTWRLLSDIAAEPIELVRVDFVHAPTGALAGYERVFGVTPVFSSKRTALVLPRQTLDVPVTNASAELLVHVREHLARTLAKLSSTRAADPLATLKSAVLKAAQQGRFGPQDVAASMGLSHRQAQRSAAQLGTTLRQLIEENRLAIACDLLRDPSRTVESIALALGYADDRAFRRAFKRYYRISPTEYRREKPGVAALRDARPLP